MLDNKEKELVYRAKRGDKDAFEEIVKIYEKRICQTIFLMVKNDSIVEDIAQEVFVKVYKNISKFNEQSSLYTWIYRITMNACYDEIKKEKKVYHLSNYMDTNEGEQEIEYEDESQNVDEIVERNINKEVLIKAIKNLNEDYRSLIVLRDVKGFSYWEISDMLDIKLGTVKSKLSRAREALKHELIEMGFSGYTIDE